MAQQKFCQECNQKRECQEVYRQLGKTEGPSVVFGVVVAFLLPIVVFIAALAAFEKILAKTIDAKGLQTTLSFLLALAATAVCVLIIKAINRRRKTDDEGQTTEDRSPRIGLIRKPYKQ